MDFYALSQLVGFALVGLAILTVAVGFSVRVFLAPTLRELFGKRDVPDGRLFAARLERLEERLDAIEHGLDRLAEAKDFDRQLGGPKLG